MKRLILSPGTHIKQYRVPNNKSDLKDKYKTKFEALQNYIDSFLSSLVSLELLLKHYPIASLGPQGSILIIKGELHFCDTNLMFKSLAVT